MCRSIKVLRSAAEPAGPEDVHAAALQYVRKVSGFRAPSRRNTEAFERAVEQVTNATTELLAELSEAIRKGAAEGPAQP